MLNCLKVPYSELRIHCLFLLVLSIDLSMNAFAGGPSIDHKTIYAPNISPYAQQQNLRANRDSLGRKIYKETELIVSFKNSVSTRTSSLTIGQYASGVRSSFGKTKNFKVVTLAQGQSLDLAMARFRSDPNVASVDYNYYVYSLAIPNDTFYGQQWGLRNPGITVNGPEGTTNADINVEQTWNYITDCSSVTVAVIDTGINYTHRDLAANMVTANRWDFVDNDNDPYPDAGNESHGTNVSGIIGARGNNNIGTSGICWQIKILPLRVLDETGIGTLANVAAAIIHAVDSGAKVINMSLGANGTTSAMNDAMNYARSNKVVVITAAGNNGSNNDNSPLYPCNYSATHANVVCVAAMDQYFSLASFSNSGANTVDVGAPGVSIYNTTPGAWILDAMTGWTLSGAWLETQCSLPTFTNMLLNPLGFCNNAGSYANNVNDIVYKNFDLSTANRARLVYSIVYNTQAEADKIFVNSKASGGDPFSAGTLIRSHTGTSPNGGTTAESNAINLTGCYTSTCTIGFQLKTDSTVTGGGVAIYGLRIETSQVNADSYLNFSGTSQAAPHVAGLAAMMMAWNPGYQDIETVNAIKNGGTLNSSLTNITRTGRVVNAMGSLKYINVPTGISITVP